MQNLEFVRFVYVFERSIMCLPGLHLFYEIDSKNNNIVKYCYM